MSSTRIPVRWHDLDPLGHVNAPVFLTYLEEGRNIWLREVLGQYFGPEQWVLARAEIDFVAEIPAYTEFVETQHELEAIGRSSVTLTERLKHPNNETVARANVVIAFWNPERRTSRPITELEREALTALRVAP